MVQEKTYRIYVAVYQSLQTHSADSVDGYFLRAGIPLDSEIANNPVVRRRLQMIQAIDKVLANLIAIPVALIAIVKVLKDLIIDFIYVHCIHNFLSKVTKIRCK